MNLDKLAAERVMGWHAKPSKVHAKQSWHDSGHRFKCFVTDWSPTTSSRDSAEIMTKMRSNGWNCLMMATATGSNMCDFYKGPDDDRKTNEPRESMPMAITTAALLACGVTDEEMKL